MYNPQEFMKLFFGPFNQEDPTKIKNLVESIEHIHKHTSVMMETLGAVSTHSYLTFETIQRVESKLNNLTEQISQLNQNLEGNKISNFFRRKHD